MRTVAYDEYGVQLRRRRKRRRRRNLKTRSLSTWHTTLEHRLTMVVEDEELKMRMTIDGKVMRVELWPDEKTENGKRSFH